MAERYWSRVPGKFVDKMTGNEYSYKCTFTGNVREWYETLIEVVYDVGLTLVDQGVSSDVLGFLEIAADPSVEVITQCSVLYGTKCSWGPILNVIADQTLRNRHRIELRNSETHEVLGIVHVMDIPCPIVA